MAKAKSALRSDGSVDQKLTGWILIAIGLAALYSQFR